MKTNSKKFNKTFPPQRDPNLVAKENLFKAIKAKRENNHLTSQGNSAVKK